LLEEVEQKRFREDLFYRINVLTLKLPPLHERKGDLALLVEHFAGDEWRVDPDVVPMLEQYSWPGNVRQLLNALDRAKILAEDDRIRVDNLPPEIVNSAQARPSPASNDVDLDTLTREHVLETYHRHASNKAQTARALGIGRRTLYRLLEKYNIAETEPESELTRDH
jgi:transcriptional regulator of acetoin/glycerol metabolism